jgi:hypothetical protein
MLTFNTRLKQVFEREIAVAIERVSGAILEGALDDLGRYKALTGEIRGLRASLALFEDAMSIVEGKPNALHGDEPRY